MTNIDAAARVLTDVNACHLDWLEAESIHILRELVAECSKPALLFSGGKDSVVVLHLAREGVPAAAQASPFPLVHIDTGHNFDEVIDFRDRARDGNRRANWSSVMSKIRSSAAPCACVARRIRATPRKR